MAQRIRLLIATGWLFWSGAPLFADEGRIAVRIIDADGNPTPARAWVRVGEHSANESAGVDSDSPSQARQWFQPVSPDTVTPYARDRSFSCDGEFTIIVPAGKAQVHVEKGKEYFPVDLDVDVKPDETVMVSARMQRWIDMPKIGWYSADMHVHLGQDDPRVLRQLALADDVHLVPAFTYWLRGRGEVWHEQWPDESYDQPIAIDPTHLITRNNIEIERIAGQAAPGASVGATFLFNLNRSVTADRYGEHFPTDADLCRVARGHSPMSLYDCDKPSWAETVIGAALGALDTMQLCHNHYHRLQTLPGGWGMIGPLAAGESNAAAGDGLFHRTNSLYYRFLNCGFRLGVSGGSAIGVMAVPSGFNRVYARVQGPLTADKMWAAIKAGRSFVTSGPMLTLSADGQQIGSTLSISSASSTSSTSSAQSTPIRIKAAVQSIEPLETLQIVVNGRVVATQDLLGQPVERVLKAELQHQVVPRRSGWLAARALYRAPDGLLRQAHTSPIYISVDDKPTAFAEDARYMLRWIDELERIAADIQRFPDAQAQRGVLDTYAEARRVYEQIIAAAANP